MKQPIRTLAYALGSFKSWKYLDDTVPKCKALKTLIHYSTRWDYSHDTLKSCYRDGTNSRWVLDANRKYSTWVVEE